MTRHSVSNNTRMGLVISLCSNHLISEYPQTASNFRHLLSCGTIVDHGVPGSNPFGAPSDILRFVRNLLFFLKKF